MFSSTIMLNNAGVDFSTLFADAGLVSAICLAIGLILCAVECFVPGFGFFGITGGVLVIFSIVYRMAIGGTWWHLLYMCLIVIVVLSVLVIIAIRSAKSGLLSKTPLIEKTTALPTDYANNETNYGFLLEKEGVTLTICKPAGKVKIDDVEYQAISNGEYIEEGTNVKVIEVDGSTIIVKRIREE